MFLSLGDFKHARILSVSNGRRANKESPQESMKARSAKQKGTKAETEVARDIQKIGVPCRRQPLSGALSDFKGDAIIDARGWGLTVEIKHHKQIAHYERFESAREQCDGLLVDTPAGRFYWLTHETLLDLIARAYLKKAPGLPTLTLGQLRVGSRCNQYHSWIKGCDLLAVRPNHREWRWWVEESLFWRLCAAAATGEFADNVE